MAGDRYVAIGSSFAAGPGIGQRAERSPKKAGRSSINYAHLLAGMLSLELDDVTFSGATTASMRMPGTDGHLSQVDAVTPGTNLVTITAGGNDVGYLPGLVSASLPRVTSLLPTVRRRVRDTHSTEGLDARFERLGLDLGLLVTEVQRRAPGCAIVLVDYLTILPADPTKPTAPLSATASAWGREVASRLADLTRHTANTLHCHYAAASELSQFHDAWSEEPWTKGFHYSLRGGAPYHPTAAGMRAVAELVAQVLDYSAH